MSPRHPTLVLPCQTFSLKHYDSAATLGFDGKDAALAALADSIKSLAKLQYRFYASGRQSLLIILQGMDASGKDSLIQHVLSGLNPQGVEVSSFKAPTLEEREHDFLWRYHRLAPRKGRFGIFNRSYYEDVLITRVHPELLLPAKLPGISAVSDASEDFWTQRLQQIEQFEQMMVKSGVVIRKFFLHLSKDEQRERFLSRLNEPEKHWKFAPSDIIERQYWDAYQKAYEAAIAATSTAAAPWHIIPADKKWVARAAVAAILVDTLSGLDLSLPPPDGEATAAFARARKLLEA